MCQKLKKPKHQNDNLEIEFWAGLGRHLYKNTYRGSIKFHNIPNKSRFILIFLQ